MSQSRKLDHLKICAGMDVEFQEKTTLLEDVHLVHDALADISLKEVSTAAAFMGRPLKAPLLICAISGGVQEAEKLNGDLARVAQKLGIGFCLGSQRPMLDRGAPIGSYEVRRHAPDVPILGNIGIQQASAADPAEIERLVTSIQADGLAVHLNPAMELSQTEGDRQFRRGFETLKRLTRRMPGKIMVKETGCGISRSVAERLKKAGVRTVDVAGAGGTSWTRVEHLRRGMDPSRRTWLDEWGIPTAASIVEVSPLGFELVASGGVRSGVDVAKCLLLGADLAGMALPVLRAHAAGGYDGALSFLARVIDELKSVMILVGAKNLTALRNHDPVITGRLRQWIRSRDSRFRRPIGSRKRQ
ncbi:MAG: type 2 isopentenyl-diphosphate Delta-isomerase [Candidatus Riflebacteria bacterium]|nr:type 2 isopentenyl-diphosphate Delta-isomerase [Candidatus Riflebacteria bacterium]